MRVRQYSIITHCTQKSSSAARPEYGVVYVALEYPQWQQLVLVKLRELYDRNGGSLPPNKEVLEELKSIAEIKPFMKKVMPFVAAMKVNDPQPLGFSMYDTLGVPWKIFEVS